MGDFFGQKPKGIGYAYTGRLGRRAPDAALCPISTTLAFPKPKHSQMMIMIDLTPYKSAIENICKELRLQRLDLIGSATRDDFSDNSDIDVLITFAVHEIL